jgi:hypothetical protein
MYDWNQTPQTITINIPIPYKVDPKKFDSVVTENSIKLNIPDMKIFKFIDLYDEVDFKSANLIIEDNKIVYYINKIQERKWPQLEFKTGSKDEIKERRRIAEENYLKYINSEREVAKNTKTDFEKYVFDKSIKIDEEKRKELDRKKEEEKNAAVGEVYSFLNELEKNKTKEINTNHETNNKQSINQSIEAPKDEVSKIEEKKIITKNENLKQIKTNSEIFDERDIQKENNEVKTASVRQQSNITVNLTEKAIPHFAARESLTKEPPYPKSKKYVPEKNMVNYL